MSDQGREQVNLILGRLDRVRPTHQGWVARCPAHPDRSPSLSLRIGERAILVKCFAGCQVADICHAIGMDTRALFFNSSRPPQRTPVPMKTAACPRWRTTATVLEQHALALFLRSEAVLEAARGLDTSTWTDGDRARAMGAVDQAYRDAERVALLDEVAYSIRAKGLETEKHAYESRCRTINKTR